MKITQIPTPLLGGPSNGGSVSLKPALGAGPTGPTGGTGPTGPQGPPGPGTGAGAWQPSTAYTANQVVQAPDGSMISRNANGTSRASFDSTEEAAWTSVNSKSGTVAQRALSDSFAGKWKASTAYTAGQTVMAPDGTLVQRIADGTSGTTYSSDNWTPVAEPYKVSGKRAVRKDELVINAADYASPQAAIDAAPAGATVRFSGTVNLTAALTITKSLTLDTVFGAQFVQATSGTPALTITASDVAILGLRFTGPQYAATVTNERAIYAHGADAATYIENLEIRRCKFDTWGQAAIWGEFIDGVTIENSKVKNCFYAGFMLLSCKNGTIRGNRITNIVGTPNAYGIALSRQETADTSVYPRTTDFAVTDNYVNGVSSWEGLDTHGGQRITFKGNTVLGCRNAISCVGSGTQYAPIDVAVINNTCDSLTTDGSKRSGIVFVGAPGGAPGSPVELATGSIIGNTVRNHGGDSTGEAGILAYVTRGLVVQGNVVHEPAANGINLYYDNYGFALLGNTVTDAWSETVSQAAAYRLRSTYNTGTVAFNTTVRGSRSATHVMEYGLYVQATTSDTAIALGPNDFSAVTTPIIDTGNLTYSQSHAKKVSQYGVSAKTRPAALVQTYSTANRTLAAYTPDPESSAYTGTPADAASTAKLADLNSLRVAYENLRAHHESLAQFVNALVDDLQAFGWES